MLRSPPSHFIQLCKIKEAERLLDMILEDVSPDAMVHRKTATAPMNEKECIIRQLAKYGVEA